MRFKQAHKLTLELSASSCRPPSPKQAYLCIGQDLFSIDNYVREQYNYSLHHLDKHQQSLDHAPKSLLHNNYVPAVLMSYTDIQMLRGLESPADYGSGIEYANMLDDASSPLWQSHPHHNDDSTTTATALQLGLWLNGSQGCRDIVNGRLDGNVHRLLVFLASRTHVTFLRVGYEFDNPLFGYLDDPDSYREAFILLANHCQTRIPKCRSKVMFVWHSWAASNVDLLAYYPGDEYVDWIGVSLFSQVYRGQMAMYANTTRPVTSSIHPMVQRVLDFAQQQDRPIMIAESTPFNGIDKMDDPWNTWFRPVLTLIERYDIGMFCYISCDWDSQPMWRNVGFGDSRLTTNATVMRLWRKHVLYQSRFQLQGVSCHQPNTRVIAEKMPIMALGSSVSMDWLSRGAKEALLGAMLIVIVAALVQLATEHKLC
jgi:hypothetical protein